MNALARLFGRRPRGAAAPAPEAPAVIDTGDSAAAHATRAHRAGQRAHLMHVRHLSGTHVVDLEDVDALASDAEQYWKSFRSALAAEVAAAERIAAAQTPDDLTGGA